MGSTGAHMLLIWDLSRRANEIIIDSSRTAGLESTAVLRGFPLLPCLSLPVHPTLGSQPGHKHESNLSLLYSRPLQTGDQDKSLKS